MKNKTDRGQLSDLEILKNSCTDFNRDIKLNNIELLGTRLLDDDYSIEDAPSSPTNSFNE